MDAKKRKRQREHEANVSKLANGYARAFNGVANQAGIDLPMPLIVKLIELFGDAIATGEALGMDYADILTPDPVS